MNNGSIKSLWRYPVKSLLGEKASRLDLDSRGVVNDRLYAVSNEQGKFGSGKDTRRFRRIDGLFSLAGKTTDDGVSIEFPDGVMLTDKDRDIDAKLTEILGQPVILSREADISHFDDGPIHILTTRSLSKLQDALPQIDIDERRFRPNIVIDVSPDASDEDLVDKVISIGEVKLKVTHKTERCRMITLEQSELNHSPKILKEVFRRFGLNFGIYASVINPGSITLGSSVKLSSE
ncbi:MAG: MOSC domain-containing protein [Kangiellaceae bacterium]|nr:MOSC domain-containing protein [Kangiellaceae bacterium]